MTVQTNTNVASFLGNGAATYPIGFKFNSAADLVVQKTVIATGVTTTLTLNSDYSVAGASVEEGGSITFSQAPTSAESIKVTRVVDLLQLTDLRNQGKFYAEVHEEVFDKLVMIDQQQQTEIDDANAKSDEAVATANSANAKSDQAVEKAAQNLVDMQAQYNAFEQGASFVVIGDYAAGLVVDGYNKIFRKDGEFYRAKAELTLPYPLNGDWATDAPNFVSVGDAVLRQELAAPAGALKVGGAALYVEQISDLLAIPVSALSDGSVAIVTATARAGAFVWMAGNASAMTATDPAQGVYVSDDPIVGTWVRLYDKGEVHVGWFGASPTPGVDNRAAILAAHNYCATSSQDRRLRFSAGKYEIHSTLTIRGLVHWQGSSDGGAGTIIEWMGSGTAAISCDAGDWYGNYQGTFKNIGVSRGATGSRAYAFDLIRCSEFLFDSIYVNDMGGAFRLRGTPITTFRKIVTAGCDCVFDYAQSVNEWANAMHVISGCNFWETAGSVFRFTSGQAYSIFVSQCWAERFKQFMSQGTGDSLPLTLTGMHVSDSSLLSPDVAGTRLIYFVAKAGDVAVNVSRIRFSDVRVSLNSQDHVCYAGRGGNTSAQTFLFEETAFEDCHLFGAQMAIFGADLFGPSVRVSGSTLAQQGYYSGNNLAYSVGQARVIETNRPQYYAVTWSSDGASKPVLGNGSIGASYTLAGGEVRCRVTLSFGSTTAKGDGVWSFSLPSAAPAPAGSRVSGTAIITVPGIEVLPAVVSGIAQNGSAVLILAKNGTSAPFGITTNATTTVTIELSYSAVAA